MTYLALLAVLFSLPATDPDPREAIERALPYLEKGGVSWMEERGCVSCHRVSFMIWSHREAATRGFSVEASRVDAWTNWALVNMLAGGEDNGGADTVAQMLLGRERDSKWREKPPRHFKTVDPYDALVFNLLDRQGEDGSWPPEGQLTTPPELTTGWTLLALSSYADPSGDPAAELDLDRDTSSPLTEQLTSIRERLPKSRERARQYLAGVDPHTTFEGLVLRAVRAHREGDPAASRLQGELLTRQNQDGGWSNLFDRGLSDAYATGLGLYALSLTGVPRDNPAVSKAVAWLIESQGEDGSWKVNAAQIRSSERSGASLDEVYTYWGTAWATLGLLRSLPR
ncbi:MAG: prenyltransferase/squalene oxidase repeat-containing protein [Planctomycetota bacterium]